MSEAEPNGTECDEVSETLGWERKHTEQPCGVRPKATLPLWMESYAARYGAIEETRSERILSYSARTLKRITLAHRAAGEGTRKGRKSGRASNRIKTFVPIRCGPQEFDEPGWMEADTVSHGGGSSSGDFLWSLTLTDFHSGWTELAALWGNKGEEVRVGLERLLLTTSNAAALLNIQ